jgi:peroxiredoxin
MEQTKTKIGSYAPDFELRGIDNQVHHLSRYLQRFRAVGVVTMSNHCPYVAHYIEPLNAIQTHFQSQGFTLVGINGNDDCRYPEETFENMQSFAKTHQLQFPYLRDTTQDVLRSFGAVCTPEAFLIDESGILCYCGAIDDAAHQLRGAQLHYFSTAVTQLLNRDAIALPKTEAIGQPIHWRA